MWTIEELEELEELQHELSEEEFALIVAILSTCKKDVRNEILSFYEKYGKDGIVTYLQSNKRVGNGNNRKRIVVLYSTIDSIFESYFLDIQNEFDSLFRSIVQTEIDYFNCEINIDDVLDMKWGSDNLNWSTRLHNRQIKCSIDSKRKLKLAFLRGDDISDVIKELYDGFVKYERALYTLETTEANAIQTEARYRIFKKLGYRKYRYHTIPDELRCDTCGEMHNKVFPMSVKEIGVTAPPMHPNCRCFITPVND